MVLPNGFLVTKSGYIPKELLLEIFAHCLEEDELGCVVPSAKSAPLCLTWVCRWWREFVIKSRCLWTGLTLQRWPMRIEDNLQLLKYWISRSDTLPLAIRFSYATDLSKNVTWDQSTAFEKARYFTEVLLNCASRWRVLDTLFPSISFAKPFLDTLVEKSHRLQYLGIRIQYWNPFSNPLFIDFSQNSSLRTVRLHSPLINPEELVSQGFPALTDLELHFCASLRVCLAWINMCPNLERLKVNLLGDQDSTTVLRGPIRQVSRLTELSITCLTTSSETGDPGFLLDQLVLPALVDFNLAMNSLYHRQPWPHVADLLDRSQAKLDSLSLSSTPMSDQEIVHCLRRCPNLWSFNVDSITDIVLEALTPRLSVIEPHDMAQTEEAEDEESNYAFLCRNLAMLEICDVDLCSLQALHNFIKTRCEDELMCLKGYVDHGGLLSTPRSCRTVSVLLLPYEPIYRTLSHPRIINDFENNIYF